MADAKGDPEGQKFDPDASNVFDEDEIDERIPCSVSYFMICIMLPIMNGLLNSFAWSGYAPYVRKNGWDLSLAGLALSIGCLGRLTVQQVIFRAGIWTCVVFAGLQGILASLAIIYPEEAVVVFLQAGSIPAFDVTVAIEGLTFDTWSDSEVQVGQAQSTVLSIFTISYAMAATFGGVIYDAGSWTGISIFHTVCSFGQLLVFVVQPAMLESFWEFIHRLRGGDEDDEDEDEDADEDEVKELGEQATSIVPGPKVNVVPAPEVPTPSGQPSPRPPGALGAAGAQADMPALPGALEEEEAVPPPASSASVKETQVVLPEKEVLPDGIQNALARKSQKSQHSQSDARSRRASARSAVSKASKGSARSRRRKASAFSKSSDAEHERGHRVLISPLLSRSSILTGSSRSSYSSYASSGHSSGRRTFRSPRQTQRLTVATHNTHGTGYTNASGFSGRSRRRNTNSSAGTRRTIDTVLTSLSKFTALGQMGEHFQYNFGIQNSLRPHIASDAVEMAVQSDDEEDAKSPRKTEVAGRKTAAEKNKGVSRDTYVVAALIAMFSFTANISYCVEWSTFAIFFAEQHKWESATWAGICQTAGDLCAGLLMGLLKNIERPNLDELHGIRKLWHGTFAQPYLLAVFAFGWAILNAGLCVPALPVAIAAQVIMGTLYVFSMKAVTDLNLFYSLGDSKAFLQLQVQCKNMDAIGALIAGGASFPLYLYNPIAPYVLCTGVSLVTCIVVMVGFCCRVGFGKEIETAEAQRARRLGLRRVSEWKTQKSMRSVVEDEDA